MYALPATTLFYPLVQRTPKSRMRVTAFNEIEFDHNNRTLISGTVTIEGVNATDAKAVLFDEAQGVPVSSTDVASDGTFSFADMPFGYYSVLIFDGDHQFRGKVVHTVVDSRRVDPTDPPMDQEWSYTEQFSYTGAGPTPTVTGVADTVLPNGTLYHYANLPEHDADTMLVGFFVSATGTNDSGSITLPATWRVLRYVSSGNGHAALVAYYAGPPLGDRVPVEARTNAHTGSSTVKYVARVFAVANAGAPPIFVPNGNSATPNIQFSPAAAFWSRQRRLWIMSNLARTTGLDTRSLAGGPVYDWLDNESVLNQPAEWSGGSGVSLVTATAEARGTIIDPPDLPITGPGTSTIGGVVAISSASHIYPYSGGTQKHWRIRILQTYTDSPGGVFAALARLDILADGESLLAGPAAISYSADVTVNSSQAANLFDGDAATVWSSDATPYPTLTLMFSSYAVPTHVVMQAGNTASLATRAPAVFTIESRSDFGQAWGVEKVVSTPGVWKAGEVRTFAVAEDALELTTDTGAVTGWFVADSEIRGVISGSSATFTVPAQAETGHTMFACIKLDSAQSVTVPSGWTLHYNDVLPSIAERAVIMSKPYAGETSVSFPLSANVAHGGVLTVVKGSHVGSTRNPSGQPSFTKQHDGSMALVYWLGSAFRNTYRDSVDRPAYHVQRGYGHWADPNTSNRYLYVVSSHTLNALGAGTFTWGMSGADSSSMWVAEIGD